MVYNSGYLIDDLLRFESYPLYVWINLFHSAGKFFCKCANVILICRVSTSVHFGQAPRNTSGAKPNWCGKN